ncbi:DUF6444 domain-containing protein [Streptomyces sp. NPDC006459]|uniref:DUF6444 domain-containing protein n=1 Tax=Streptomyces sp. NPDC006459 TaxID=3154303 RepID=UPI0033B7BE1B
MSADPTLPTYEELSSLVVELSGRLARALDELAGVCSELVEAKARIMDLEARLGQNSRNSSKPPSSDGLAKPAPKSLREKSGRSPGRLKGQPGITLRQVGDPDHEVEYRPQGPCSDCGSDLAEASVAHIERRQVFDLPEHIGLEVTEHRILTCRCACGRAENAPRPKRSAPRCSTGPAWRPPAST